jgi:two-component system, OmpR family, heavy metal sensor histidine kinase CusS
MRLSLAGRLTILYGGLAPVLVAAAVAVQYYALVGTLANEDDHLLAGTLEAAQQSVPRGAAWRRPDQSDQPIIRFLDSRCLEISPTWAGEPPVECPLALSGATVFRSWRPSGGYEWRIASQRLTAADGGWIEALLDRSGDEAVLRAYRARFGLVLVITVLGSALLGSVVARRGLRPLVSLGDRVSRIGARSLDQRVSPADAPVEIRHLAGSFDAMLARLDRAFRVLSQFSTDLAHEFRTPVHVLRQQAEVALQRARTPEEYREVLTSSLEELERLGRMVEDTLFLARTEDPHASVERLGLYVHQELSDVADFLSAVAEQAGVSLRAEALPTLKIRANRSLVRRALVNAAANAIRFTPPGGSVTLRGARISNGVVLEVSDTGEGIPADVLPRVFDRHFRGSASRTRDSGGTGLGLSIVQGIMHLHEGEVQITSVPGAGTTLHLIFPDESGQANLTKP